MLFELVFEVETEDYSDGKPRLCKHLASPCLALTFVPFSLFVAVWERRHITLAPDGIKMSMN